MFFENLTIIGETIKNYINQNVPQEFPKIDKIIYNELDLDKYKNNVLMAIGYPNGSFDYTYLSNSSIAATAEVELDIIFRSNLSKTLNEAKSIYSDLIFDCIAKTNKQIDGKIFLTLLNITEYTAVEGLQNAIAVECKFLVTMEAFTDN